MAKRCSSCGKDSPDDSIYCNYCSRPLEVDVICPKCGAKNPSYGVFCGSCGDELARVTRPPEPPPPAVPLPSRLEGPVLAPHACPNCGSRVSVYDFECPHCRRVLGEDDSESLYGGYDGPSEPASATPLAAGILMIITGILAIGQGGLFLLTGSIAAQIDVPTGGITCCGLLSILFGLAALIGGYFSLSRSSWTFAMLGAVLAMLSGAFVIGFVLGLIALILVGISKEEFSD
jgi:ribosomal protein L40E